MALTKVKVVLQGKHESFEDYEKRLNMLLAQFRTKDDISFVSPSDAADGRICCVINRIFLKPLIGRRSKKTFFRKDMKTITPPPCKQKEVLFASASKKVYPGFCPEAGGVNK